MKKILLIICIFASYQIHSQEILFSKTIKKVEIRGTRSAEKSDIKILSISKNKIDTITSLDYSSKIIDAYVEDNKAVLIAQLDALSTIIGFFKYEDGRWQFIMRSGISIPYHKNSIQPEYMKIVNINKIEVHLKYKKIIALVDYNKKSITQKEIWIVKKSKIPIDTFIYKTFRNTVVYGIYNPYHEMALLSRQNNHLDTIFSSKNLTKDYIIDAYVQDNQCLFIIQHRKAGFTSMYLYQLEKRKWRKIMFSMIEIPIEGEKYVRSPLNVKILNMTTLEVEIDVGYKKILRVDAVKKEIIWEN
jgi:hypothetical protein